MIEDLEEIESSFWGKVPDRKCVVCGREFKPKLRQITCSATCHRKRRQESRDKYNMSEKHKEANRRFFRKNRKWVPVAEFNRVVEELNALRTMLKPPV